jgi:hypothetical protein
MRLAFGKTRNQTNFDVDMPGFIEELRRTRSREERIKGKRI